MSIIMLLIHESELMRKIVTKYLYSDAADIILETAETVELGLVLLSEKKYDIVMAPMQLSPMEGTGIHSRMRKTGLNKETVFILMTSTNTKKQNERIKAQGVRNVILSPFTATRFIKVINDAFNPLTKREHKRYGFPDTYAFLDIEDQSITGNVINLSQNGVLTEFNVTPDMGSLLSPVTLDIQFPEEFRSLRVQGLFGVFLRLNTISYSADYTPNRVRVAYMFQATPPAADSMLKTALNIADRENEKLNRNNDL